MPPPQDKLEDLEFPLGGLNLLAEFQEQPPGTTADCENVRGTNPDSLRERGGSRAGLLKYSPYQIPANTSLSMVIQHLNMIVDPQATALGQNFQVPDDDWVPDPLNPGTYVPPGGWGYPGGPQPPDDGSVRFTQAGGNVGTSESLPANTLTVTLPATVAAGQVIVIAVLTIQSSQLSVPGDPTSGIGDKATTLTVKDGNGTNYTQIGTYRTVNDEAFVISDVRSTAFYYRLSLWRRVAGATGGGTITVVANPADLSGSGDATFFYANAIVHKNVDNAAPITASSSAAASTINPPSLSTISTGSFTPAVDGAIVAFLYGPFDPTAGLGQAPGTTPPLFLRRNESNNLWSFGRYPASGSPVNVAFNDPNSGGNPVLLAFGAALKKA